MKSICFAILFPLLLVSCSSSPETLSSPDERITVKLGVQGDQAFTYRVFLDGELLLHPSPVTLEFKEQANFGGGLDLVRLSERHVDKTWDPLWGKSSRVRDQYREYLFRLSERDQDGRFLEWEFRIYDDGVAFRYRFPEGSGFGSFSLTEERTGFNLDPSVRVWATDHGGYYTSQEHLYTERDAGEIGPEELVGCPVLAEVGPSSWVLLTEADLTDWSGLYFKRGGEGESTLVSSLASLRRNPSVKVESEAPCETPWRVIMVGEDPGDLVESHLIANLNDPCEWEDTDWIKPGASAWDRWWSGDYGPDAGFELGMNTATMKYFIDLADRMDWEYMIIDWTWYGPVFEEGGGHVPRKDADITKPAAEVDVRGLIEYAREREVGIILWVLSGHLDRQMDEALALYGEWGAAGIKVDFMDADDQDMVNWYHRLARKAAEHQLVIDFHGAYKPTGVSRTLPNMLTREGVLGNEYNKWSDLVTPEHAVTLPYTRGLLGEMDFTPGGFRHAHREDFVAVGAAAPNPMVMGTRCHQLAMPVIYESAFTVFCDSPYSYKDQPGTGFLARVPVTWSETRFLQGYPGRDIVLARRSDHTWYVGGMTGAEPGVARFSLDFLEEGPYAATLWHDTEDTREDPSRLGKEQRTVSRDELMEIPMERGGGFVMILEPA